jgi:putative acetyltransferase
LQISEDDLTGKNIADLLWEHLENMHEITPSESVHALDLEALRSPDITFWSAWEGSELLGCGALKELDSRSDQCEPSRLIAVRVSLLRFLNTLSKKPNGVLTTA